MNVGCTLVKEYLEAFIKYGFVPFLLKRLKIVWSFPKFMPSYKYSKIIEHLFILLLREVFFNSLTPNTCKNIVSKESWIMECLFQ